MNVLSFCLKIWFIVKKQKNNDIAEENGHKENNTLENLHKGYKH